MLFRPPCHPALKGVVTSLWAGWTAPTGPSLERVIPTGEAHLSWRARASIQLGFEAFQHEHYGVLGGPRSCAHAHDLLPVMSVGAMLAPGAVPCLFDASARSLAEGHTGLDALWGASARHLQEQLDNAAPEGALEHVEAFLVARLRHGDIRPELSLALRSLEAGLPVAAVARKLGRSSRCLNLWFDDAVGLSPGRWARVRRLQQALRLAIDEPDASTVAHLAGYVDQSHLCRDMRAISGVTLTEWRRRGTAAMNHVPVAQAGC